MLQKLPALSLAALSVATLALTGCGGISSVSSTRVQTQVKTAGLRGTAHGGQNPIQLAAIQIYQAGTMGSYGTGATALIPSGSYYAGGATGCVASMSQVCYAGVVTDANGNFSIATNVSCTSGTNLYITATGGNPGSGTNNSSLLISGFGLCDNQANVPSLDIDEITTIGTVWALAPFMTDSYNAANQTGSINIGAPPTNVTGLNQAFADINTLVNYESGYTPGPAASSGISVPTGASVPSQEIFALADSLAACVNTTGNGACTSLFSYTTVNSVAPTDTTGAALNIANNPGVNANNILALKNPQAPWSTTFIAANDLTLSVTYTGSGLDAPSALAVDASGNIWVANSAGNSVTELSHTGNPVGSSPFTAGGITAPAALAIDTSGNVWIANNNPGPAVSTLTELSKTGTNMTGSPYSGGGLSEPSAISLDGLGNVWLPNYTGNSVSEFSPSGTALSPTGGYTATGLTTPIGLAINPH